MARLRRTINRKLLPNVYHNGNGYYYYSHPSMIKKDDFGNPILNKKGQTVREKEHFGTDWKAANAVAEVLNQKFSTVAERIESIIEKKHKSDNPVKGFTVSFVVSSFMGQESNYDKAIHYKRWSEKITKKNENSLQKFKESKYGNWAYAELGIPEYKDFISNNFINDGQRKAQTLLKQVDEYAKSNGFLGKRPPSGHVVEEVQVTRFEKRQRPRIPNIAVYEAIKAKMPLWYQWVMDFSLHSCQAENEIITAQIMKSIRKHPSKPGWMTFTTTRSKTNQEITIEFETTSPLGVVVQKMTKEAAKLGSPYLVNNRYDKPYSRTQLAKSKKTHRNQVTGDYFIKVMPKHLKGTDLEIKPKGYVFHEIRSLSIRMHLAIAKEKGESLEATKDSLKLKTGHRVDRMIDLYAKGDQKEVLVGCANITMEEIRAIKIQE